MILSQHPFDAGIKCVRSGLGDTQFLDELLRDPMWYYVPGQSGSSGLRLLTAEKRDVTVEGERKRYHML